MGDMPGDRSHDGLTGVAAHDRAATTSWHATQPAGFSWSDAGALVALGTDVVWARERMLGLQRTAGNRAVTEMIDSSPWRAPVAQRQPPVAAPAGPVAPPPGPVPATPLPDFGNASFLHGGPRFDLAYRPVGPLPAIGKVTVTLKIHVIFKDFDRSAMRRKEFVRHRWTRDQLRDFKWPEDQKATWVAKFATAVSDGWKEKHVFVLDQPDFAPHRATCDVQVKHVDDPAQANNVITAQWVPRGAPRLRSSVSGATSELDVRDVDEPETHTVRPASLIRQVGGFDHDSAELNSTVVSGINEFEDQFRRLRQPGQRFDRPPDEITVEGVGRATAPGARQYNKNLGLNRASAVVDRLMDDLSLSSTTARGAGEENASDDPKFRRVDVMASVGDEREVKQNVAAHEAGHMFGLGDEYVDEKPPSDVLPKFAGDLPTHHQDVRETMGDEAANDLLVQDSPSIMSTGSDVQPGHYVYFLRALNSVTGKSWKVE